MRILFVVPCSPYYASGVVRVEQYRPFLRARGIAHRVVPYFSAFARRHHHLLVGPSRVQNPLVRGFVKAAVVGADALHAGLRQLYLLCTAWRYDALVLQWVMLPRPTLRLLHWLRVRFVVDLDDAVFLDRPRRAEFQLRRAWRVVAGSEGIREYAAARNAATVLVPSAVDLDRFPAVPAPPRGGAPVRIGWIGSPATVEYLRALVEPLRSLARCGHRLELVIVGTGNRSDVAAWFAGLPVRLQPHYRGDEIPAIVASFDIGVMPLADTPWERSKCAMKALLYMAASRPAVCSAVGENRRVVVEGVTGFLVSADHEWTEALERLVRDEQLRVRMGRAGRARVAERYSTDVCFAQLERAVYEPLAALRQRVRAGPAHV